MTDFEPQISGIGSDRSTNWATTTSSLFEHLISLMEKIKNAKIILRIR